MLVERSGPVRRLLVGLCAAAIHVGASAQDRAGSLFDLSIEELGQLQVTSVSRRAENLNRAAASIYVVTAEDIRRAGITSIPEALRLVPGAEVARNGASEWTVSLRGFSSDLSNKLLVLMDGRSMYSPLFGGVFWDVQDTFISDIERIEVISGPGGTLWGANAVNGVVNIATQSAADTPGSLLEVGAGDEEQSAAFRHGWRINEDMDARAFVKTFHRDSTELASGEEAFDDWEMQRAGFALNWRATANDRIDVRANAYDAEEHALVRSDFMLGTLPPPDMPGRVDLSGHNVVARWRRDVAPDSNWQLQFYFDHTDREIPGSFNEARDTYDFEFEHDLRNIGRHDLIWGAGYRRTSDDIGNTTFATFMPASRTDDTLSGFLQDRIELRAERLFVTLGSKFENNDYTGFEYQPMASVAWLPDNRQTVWGSISRAVRIPARLDTDLRLIAPLSLPGVPLPVFVSVSGNPDFRAETLFAYEAGYRIQVGENLSFDVSLFNNEYDHLQTQETSPPTLVPGPPEYLLLQAMLENLMEAESHGGTLAANWQPSRRLRLQMHYARLNLDLVMKSGSVDANAVNVAGNSPSDQIGVHAFVELPNDLELYAGARYVDDLPNQGVPSYTALDLSLGWEPMERLRVSLTVNNANDDRHIEFGDGRFIERRSLLKAAWTF